MPVKISPETLDKILAIMGVGDVSMWPCIKGNGTVMAYIRTSTQMRAKVGDRIPVRGGGFIQKVADDGWTQWRFFARRDDPPPLTGKVLLWSPGAFVEPHHGAGQQKLP